MSEHTPLTEAERERLNLCGGIYGERQWKAIDAVLAARTPTATADIRVERAQAWEDGYMQATQDHHKSQTSCPWPTTPGRAAFDATADTGLRERVEARDLLAGYIASQTGTGMPTPPTVDRCEPDPEDYALADEWIAALDATAAPTADTELTQAGRYLREAAKEGNPNMEPWSFVPCAREHRPGCLCIQPDGHDAPTTDTGETTP